MISETNKVEVKASIHDNIYLDQKYPKGKQVLKIKDSGREEQLKTSVVAQAKTNSPNPSNDPEKARKAKKKKDY